MPTAVQSDDDQALLRRFARGEVGALESLAGRYEGHLLGLARALLRGNEALARDAVQETWLRVIRHAGNFAGKSSVKTWLYRITINRCHDLRQRVLQEGSVPHAQDADRGAASVVLTPAVAGAAEESMVRVRGAVDRLSEDARLVLLLCYHRGLTHEEAAGVMDVPVGTLKSRLHGALAKLRDVLPPDLAEEVRA